jgi:hypothetical protein
LQTRGLKNGKAVVVCTLAAAASMVSGVLVGLLALGEGLPRTAGRRALRVLSWALILAGVSNLAGGGGGGGGDGEGPAAAALRRAEDRVRAARLPHGLRMWLLGALRVLDGGGKGSRGGGGKGPGGSVGSLLANGHGGDEGGPALPIVAAAAAPPGEGGPPG